MCSSRTSILARLQYGCSTLLGRIDLGMSSGCNTVAVDKPGQKGQTRDEGARAFDTA